MMTMNGFSCYKIPHTHPRLFSAAPESFLVIVSVIVVHTP